MKDTNYKILGRDWAEIQAMQQGTYKPETIKIEPGKDYGSDPLGNGMFRMVPSGRIVTAEERKEILGQ